MNNLQYSILPLSKNKFTISSTHQGDTVVGRADRLVGETDHFKIADEDLDLYLDRERSKSLNLKIKNSDNM